MSEGGAIVPCTMLTGVDKLPEDNGRETLEDSVTGTGRLTKGIIEVEDAGRREGEVLVP